MQLRLLRSTEISKALAMCQKAFAEDPVMLYFIRVPDTDSGATQFWKLWNMQIAKFVTAQVSKGLAWTVGDIRALMTYSTTDAVQKSADDYYTSILPHGGMIASLSEEQQKRVLEYKGKLGKAVEDILGSRKEEMFDIGLLATAPQHQGRGYASALVKLAVAEADAEGRDTWLFSSNIANEGFYNYLGFVSKCDVILGDDNPTWQELPVVVKLMIREAKTSYRGL